MVVISKVSIVLRKTGDNIEAEFSTELAVLCLYFGRSEMKSMHDGLKKVNMLYSFVYSYTR